MTKNHRNTSTLHPFLFGLIVDDVRVVLVGLGCRASAASVPRRGWQPNPTRTTLSSPMMRSYRFKWS